MMGPLQARLIAECMFRFYLSLLNTAESQKELRMMGLTNSSDLASISDTALQSVNNRLRTTLRKP